MNKLRNHSIGASVTALTLVAVVLTGCSETDRDDDCHQPEAMSASLVGKVGGTGGGKGGTGGGGARGGGSSLNKGGSGKVNKPNGTGKGKIKPGKVDIDGEDCD